MTVKFEIFSSGELGHESNTFESHRLFFQSLRFHQTLLESINSVYNMLQ